jgi:hypothetical protein
MANGVQQESFAPNAMTTFMSSGNSSKRKLPPYVTLKPESEDEDDNPFMSALMTPATPPTNTPVKNEGDSDIKKEEKGGTRDFRIRESRRQGRDL